MSPTKGRRVIPLTPVEDAPVNDPAANARAQIAAHGPGLTFGELAIGECFTWPPPIPVGPTPIVKVDATHYEFLIHGTGPMTGRGIAEAFYRVETWELPA
jgi:hypothetical protein